MPELPEVETVVRTLSPLIVGQSIVSAGILNAKTLQGDEALSLSVGRTIQSVARRGKLVLVRFTPTESDIFGFAVHLRMTGRLFVYPNGMSVKQHTRAFFDLSNGSRLFFDDARKFGSIRMLSPKSLEKWGFWQKLGPEPFDLSAHTFAVRVHQCGSAIKSVLLNQSCIAGIGNIYADESLFRAGIAPHEKASSIAEVRLEALYVELVRVLSEAIEACGSSVRDYRTALGDVGSFQNRLLVYGRGGKPCVKCGAVLKKERVAGRGTVWCPLCQSK